MLRYSKIDKQFLEKIHLLSGGVSYKDCRKFIESFLALLIVDFQDNASTYFPFLGDIEVEYKGEKVDEDGKKAIVSINVTPNDFFIRNIGLCVDGQDTDIEKHLKEEIQEIFQTIEQED